MCRYTFQDSIRYKATLPHHFETMLPKYHTRHIAGIRYQILIAGILLLLTSCWEKQDHVVSPPSHPTYRLSGTVSYTLSDRPVSAADLSLIMTELYHGDFMDTLLTQTDEAGYYQFEGFYRGRYDIPVLDAG